MKAQVNLHNKDDSTKLCPCQVYNPLWKYHLQWVKPNQVGGLRAWLFYVWNEYDDWLYNGIHGFRICGLEVGQVNGWLDKVCWRLLPIIRFFNRRPEWTHGASPKETGS